MQLNFDAVDHQMKVKVAEIFWGAPVTSRPEQKGAVMAHILSSEQVVQPFQLI